jgi:hypothetical protein
MSTDTDLGRQSAAAETERRKDSEAGHIEADAFDKRNHAKYNP